MRTGRASTSLLDNIKVEAYGSVMPLNQLSSVSVPDPKTLVIQPYDASQIGNIEKAIQKSDLGLNPNNDGSVIRLALPQPIESLRRDPLPRRIARALDR